MKGVLLWVRTKCNGSLSFLSQTCTLGCLQVNWIMPYCVSEHFEWGLSPPCVVTQIPHVFWHNKLKSLSCLVQSISLINWNLPYHQTYQNLPSNEGVTYSPPPPFFFLAGNEGSGVVSLPSPLSCTKMTREETVIFTPEKQRTKYSRCSLHFPNQNENVATAL